jgi:UDP-N-acetyl-D-mannosaminuronate dehydrogenase|tara:strand:- start:3730 stop:4476 length:747 start_codon:yes stop_codon:yes gene_type:complete
MKKIGIIGYGEIGQSLEKLYLGKDFVIQINDTGLELDQITSDVDVLNIAIPFTDQEKFVNIVSHYILDLEPKLTIIHSTITPGTTLKVLSKLEGKHLVVHSPVRGIHPNLYEGLKTFTKFIGSDNKVATAATKEHYNELDINYEMFKGSKATELAKVLSTTYYGLCIAFHDDMNKLCKEHNVKYEEVATKWNKTYNDGYNKLGMDNVIRPVLYPPKDGKIGGHCVVPNAELCKQFFDSLALDYIINLK